jgi:glycosyltransferase involved in cell wall biosynthesis
MTSLTPDVLREIEKIKRAFVVAGIPSFRNAKTIAKVIKNVGNGLARYFPHLTTVIVNADGGSEDNTREVALSTPVPREVKKIITPYQGLPGKGSAFHAIFEIADRLKAKICLVFDADLRSITPEWVWTLAKPIYHHSFGFVTPYYLRYKHDGTITNMLAYPMTRSLYGIRIRQPIGGEFGLTGALAKIYSHEDVWQTDIAKFGIDIFITTLAIVEGIRIAQASLGVKLHDPKDPASSLVPMFKQVTGTLFSLMIKFEEKWQATKGSREAEIFDHKVKLVEIEGKEIEPEYYRIEAKKKYEENKEIIKAILPFHIYKEVKNIFSHKNFHLSSEMWTKIVYDFAVAYNFSSFEKEEILEALIPFYFARISSFAEETHFLSSPLTESLIEGYAEIFEKEKKYLKKRWSIAKRKLLGNLEIRETQ